MAEKPRALNAIDGEVYERSTLIVDAIHAEGTKKRPLGTYRRMAIDVALHVVGDAACKLATTRDFGLVHGNAHARVSATI